MLVNATSQSLAMYPPDTPDVVETRAPDPYARVVRPIVGAMNPVEITAHTDVKGSRG